MREQFISLCYHRRLGGVEVLEESYMDSSIVVADGGAPLLMLSIPSNASNATGVVAATFGSLVFFLLLFSRQPQMIWTNAAFIVAAMVDFQAEWNFFVM